MILTVAQTYPTPKNLYNNGFVHARVKQYKEEGLAAKAFIICNNEIHTDYIMEGIEVLAGDSSKLVNIVNSDTRIKCVCFHFLNVSMLKAIKYFRKDIAIAIFVHGNEALWWYQRIFPDRFNGLIRTLKFIKYVVVNTYSILRIRRFINVLDLKANLVFVSEWMKIETLRNWGINESRVVTHIIPNLINEKVFPYKKKEAKLRYKVLFIRQFTSGKYALDIAMDIIRILETYPEAHKMEITIVGDGWLYDKYTSKIKEFKNIKFIRKFLSHDEIAEMHCEHGIFLCPTRQDAQGVSMCEAMSSGLVPIASPNTAIPEFLPLEYNLAFENAEDAAKRIVEIMRNETLFEELSEKVSSYINQKCCIEETTQKEIEMMKNLTN